MEKFIKYNVITAEQLNHAKHMQKIQGGLIGEKLVELGYITGEKMKNFATRVLDEM